MVKVGKRGDFGLKEGKTSLMFRQEYYAEVTKDSP